MIAAANAALRMNGYLFGSIVLLGFWAATLIALHLTGRKNQLPEFWWASIVCSLLGVTEFLFVPEYWDPPSILKFGVIPVIVEIGIHQSHDLQDDSIDEQERDGTTQDLPSQTRTTPRDHGGRTDAHDCRAVDDVDFEMTRRAKEGKEEGDEQHVLDAPLIFPDDSTCGWIP